MASSWLRTSLSILLGLVIWELAVRLWAASSLIVVPPSAVAQALYDMTVHEDLLHDVAVSGYEFAYGFGLAIVLGVSIGIIVGTVRTVGLFVEPWLDAFYATPILALGPLLIAAFGIGYTSKIVIVFLVAVFPILINTRAGITMVDPQLIEMATAFHLSSLQRVVKVRLPYALPSVVAGIRVASARGLVGIVVGELFGARAGLGNVIIRDSQLFRTANVFAAVVIFACLGAALNALLRSAEVKLSPWRGQ